jgi:type VI secretion system Hcp family effector
LLMKALDTSEKLTVFSLTFMRMNELMILEDYYIIELTDAQIVGVRQKKLNTLNPDNDWSDDMESVWFTYDSINWAYDPNDANITSEADWGFEQSYVLQISDLNYDGTVNMLDLAVLANEWLVPGNW